MLGLVYGVRVRVRVHGVWVYGVRVRVRVTPVGRALEVLIVGATPLGLLEQPCVMRLLVNMWVVGGE